MISLLKGLCMCFPNSSLPGNLADSLLNLPKQNSSKATGLMGRLTGLGLISTWIISLRNAETGVRPHGLSFMMWTLPKTGRKRNHFTFICVCMGGAEPCYMEARG